MSAGKFVPLITKINIVDIEGTRMLSSSFCITPRLGKTIGEKIKDGLSKVASSSLLLSARNDTLS